MHACKADVGICQVLIHISGSSIAVPLTPSFDDGVAAADVMERLRERLVPIG